jgi:hypothetical protein
MLHHKIETNFEVYYEYPDLSKIEKEKMEKEKKEKDCGSN